MPSHRECRAQEDPARHFRLGRPPHSWTWSFIGEASCHLLDLRVQLRHRPLDGSSVAMELDCAANRTIPASLSVRESGALWPSKTHGVLSQCGGSLSRISSPQDVRQVGANFAAGFGTPTHFSNVLGARACTIPESGNSPATADRARPTLARGTKLW
jgi:hypothetical protein